MNDLLNLFYPRLCLLCQRSLMEGEEHICLHCSNHLPYTHFTDMETNPVCLLLQGKTSFVAATALLHFTKGGSGQKLIHSLKYHGNKKLGYELGHMAATTYRETGLFDTVDLLLPVPLHPKRMRQRGYNQSEWIAYGIRSATGIAVDTSSLSRIKKTESQTRKQIFYTNFHRTIIHIHFDYQFNSFTIDSSFHRNRTFADNQIQISVTSK